MRASIALNRFPVLSESFVIRLIESLHKKGIGLSIYTIEAADTKLLQQLSPCIYEGWKSGYIDFYYTNNIDSSKHTTLRLGISRLKLALSALIESPLITLRLLLKGINPRYVVGAHAFSKMHRNHAWDYLIHAQFLTVAASIATSKYYGVKDFCLCTHIRGSDITKKGIISIAAKNEIINSTFLAFCVSDSLAQRAIQFGFDKNIVRIIYSPIPLDKLPFILPSIRSKTRLRFIQVGRLVEKKGHEMSLRMLASSGLDDFDFCVIGDGKLSTQLRRLAADLGIDHRVYFLGSQDHENTIRHITESDIMLIPSLEGSDGDSEGIPNVLKEAMACGCICVGSTHSGIPELIQDNVSGFLFKEKDLQAYLDAILRTIELRERWDSIAMAARDVVAAQFGHDQLANKTIDAYSFCKAN